jgi:hypothetical protein
MENDQSNTVGHRRGGGPKTDAGKRRSKLNALKHGRYAKLPLPKNGPLRAFARLQKQILMSLVETFAPKDPVEMNWVQVAADVKAREAYMALWEEGAIQKQIKSVHEKYTMVESRRDKERALALELEEELQRLEKEEAAGLCWQECSHARLSFLLGAVRSVAGDNAAQEFQELLIPDERKTFIEQKVRWDDQTVLSYLMTVTSKEIRTHQKKVAELTTQLEQAEQCGEKDRELERACILVGTKEELVRSSLGSYRRQFDRAIESLMWYRGATLDLAAKQRNARKCEVPGSGDAVHGNEPK